MTESLTERWERERQKSMQREDPRLTSLLARLEEEDKYFKSNVSDIALKAYSDESLLHDLIKTYKDNMFPLFPINLEEDLVGEEAYIATSLWNPLITTTPEAKGIVTKVNEKKVSVNFANRFICTLEDSNLYVYGRRSRLFRREKCYPETRGDYFKLAKGDLVKLRVERMELVYCSIPRGKMAISAQEGHEYELKIFGVDDIKFHTHGVSFYVFRKNHINFKELYRECYND